MPLNKPDGYNVTDIEFTKPKCVKFNSNRNGHSNPLEPSYNLQSVENRPPTPVKFQRCSLTVSDIEGTKSRPTWKGGAIPREVNVLDDVPGARN